MEIRHSHVFFQTSAKDEPSLQETAAQLDQDRLVVCAQHRRNPNDAAVVQTIIAMGEVMGLNVIADKRLEERF